MSANRPTSVIQKTVTALLVTIFLNNADVVPGGNDGVPEAVGDILLALSVIRGEYY